MKIRFLGTRGSIPSPGPETVVYGGNTTCVEIISDENVRIFIDAGTGIRRANIKFVSDSQDIVKIFFTHAHWDHLQGLPFFGQMYIPEKKIQLYMNSIYFEEIKNDIIKQMTGQTFPIQFKSLPSNIEFIPVTDSFNFDKNFKVDLFENHHPGGATSLKFTNNDKIFTFATDNELILLKEYNNNKANSYDAFINFCKNSNVIAHDGQYLDLDLLIKKGWGHSTINDVVELFCKTNPDIGVFTHHDPERRDFEVKEMEDWAISELSKKNCKTKISAAREDLIIEI